nr:immunoglobulin light chain junction region [Macaca mulatta]MOW06437.1 immunoglobulin light chain junction region [Macaca mulatta]MOW07393.1 immunoglobulin light chain junction region [Macaca mulatta]
DYYCSSYTGSNTLLF